MKTKGFSKADLPCLAGCVLVTLLLFFAVFHFKYPTDYGKLGGDNIWQSASTVKYTNMWLAEGAAALGFTNYENFSSIEFISLRDRGPFISYPSGNTLLVYAAARLAGRTEIDISFLKHFQELLFALESALFAVFAALLARHKTGAGRELCAGMGVLSAFLWMLLPVNAYYMTNVFFTDQSVILWVMLFLVLEMLTAAGASREAGTETGGIARGILLFLRGAVIFCGVLTDYYFWILVFCVFALRTAGAWAADRSPQKTLRTAAGYCVPVLLALAAFFLQISRTEGWLNLLLYKFRFRTGGMDDGGAVFRRLLENVTTSFTQEQRSFFAYLVLVWMGGIVLPLLWYLMKEKKWAALCTDDTAALLAGLLISVPFQIFLLKNHSAVHEFSMIKATLPVALTPVLIVMAAERVISGGHTVTVCDRDISSNLFTFILAFLILVLITGVPTSTSGYYVSRDGEEAETMALARFLREHTAYEDVCFTLDPACEIGIEPPQDLTVSHKRVYAVSSAEETETRFPELPDGANKLMVVRKTGTGTETETDTEAETGVRAETDAEAETGAKTAAGAESDAFSVFPGASLRAEDDRYLLLELP